MKLLNKAIGLLVGILGGMLARSLFKKIWQAVTGEDEAPTATDARRGFNPRARMKRQVDQLVNYTQGVIRTSELRRYAYWAKADTSSPEKWAETTEPYRTVFHEEQAGYLVGYLAASARPKAPSSRFPQNAVTPNYRIVEGG